jgi:hypothetical protein
MASATHLSWSRLALLGLCACASSDLPVSSSPQARVSASVDGDAAPPAVPSTVARPKGGPRFERAFEEAYNGHWPCRGARGLVFCVRNSTSFAVGGDNDFVDVRIDLVRQERRVIGLSRSIGEYVSDGIDVYALGEKGLYRMPRAGSGTELVHPFSEPGSDEATAHLELMGKDVWQHTLRGNTSRFVGWHLGEPKPFAELTHPRHADSDASFVAGFGRLERFDGESSRVLLDVASRKQRTTRLPTDLAVVSGPGTFAMNAKESFWTTSSERDEPGRWQILAVRAADDATRVLYDESWPEPAVTPGPFAMIADDAYVYFLKWARPWGDSGTELMRIPVGGGDPEHLGGMHEHGGGSMWFDGDALYVSGSNSGVIYRWWR